MGLTLIGLATLVAIVAIVAIVFGRPFRSRMTPTSATLESDPATIEVDANSSAEKARTRTAAIASSEHRE